MTQEPATITDDEDAYTRIMGEFRRRDIGSVYDLILGLSLDGCPSGMDRLARIAHCLDILKQISEAVEEERDRLIRARDRKSAA